MNDFEFPNPPAPEHFEWGRRIHRVSYNMSVRYGFHKVPQIIHLHNDLFTNRVRDGREYVARLLPPTCRVEQQTMSCRSLAINVASSLDVNVLICAVVLYQAPDGPLFNPTENSLVRKISYLLRDVTSGEPGTTFRDHTYSMYDLAAKLEVAPERK